eukprot:547743-Rhodomonas_salina.1
MNMTEVSSAITDADIKCNEGRLLLIRTQPTGALGPVWHLNVYNHCASAQQEKLAPMWRVCSEILMEAQAQGAAVILAGDLKVTIHNKESTELAVGETDFLWNAMASGQEADLDHVVAFPADIQMSRK